MCVNLSKILLVTVTAEQIPPMSAVSLSHTQFSVFYVVTLGGVMSSNLRPIVISGPSGSGKSTLLQRLFKDFPGCFEFSVSRKINFILQK